MYVEWLISFIDDPMGRYYRLCAFCARGFPFPSPMSNQRWRGDSLKMVSRQQSMNLIEPRLVQFPGAVGIGF